MCSSDLRMYPQRRHIGRSRDNRRHPSLGTVREIGICNEQKCEQHASHHTEIAYHQHFFLTPSACRGLRGPNGRRRNSFLDRRICSSAFGRSACDFGSPTGMERPKSGLERGPAGFTDGAVTRLPGLKSARRKRDAFGGCGINVDKAYMQSREAFSAVGPDRRLDRPRPIRQMAPVPSRERAGYRDIGDWIIVGVAQREIEQRF